MNYRNLLPEKALRSTFHYPLPQILTSYCQKNFHKSNFPLTKNILKKEDLRKITLFGMNCRVI